MEVTSEIEDSASPWLVVAKNRRVNKKWEELQSREPENARECYEYLCNTPMQRERKKVFPLKGKKYKGVWEYEVTKGDRVYYMPDKEHHKVVVYYAGEHPKRTPEPPSVNSSEEPLTKPAIDN